MALNISFKVGTLIYFILFFSLFSATAFADSTRVNDIGPFNSTAIVTLEDKATMAAAADVPQANFIGGVIYGYEIQCVSDDAVTLTLTTQRGSELAAVTTTTAIVGEVGLFDKFYPVNDTMKYQLTAVSGDTCDIEITLWRR